MPALAHRVSRPRGTGSVGAGHRVSRRQCRRGAHPDAFRHVSCSQHAPTCSMPLTDLPSSMPLTRSVSLYVCVCVRVCGCDRRVGLALQGTLLVILSMASGYGLAAHCGVPFTTLQQILPFILIAIGSFPQKSCLVALRRHCVVYLVGHTCCRQPCSNVLLSHCLASRVPQTCATALSCARSTQNVISDITF